MERGRAGYGWGAALVVGALLRLLFFYLRPTVAGDALMYGDLAHNMVAHHVYGFSGAVIQPTLIRLPGYPLFLAACFAVFGVGKYGAVVAVQMVVDLLGCALLGVLAERLARVDLVKGVRETSTVESLHSLPQGVMTKGQPSPRHWLDQELVPLTTSRIVYMWERSSSRMNRRRAFW